MLMVTFRPAALAALALAAAGCAMPGAEAPPPAAKTPIRHLIVVVGENVSFDNLYGIYDPPPISRYAKPGFVDHTDYDHAAILKFIEMNWGLAPLSPRSRDNLPKPVMSAADSYVPRNRPAIGDLTNLFQF